MPRDMPETAWCAYACDKPTKCSPEWAKDSDSLSVPYMLSFRAKKGSDGKGHWDGVSQ